MHLKKKHYTLKKIPHLVQISILLILCLFFLCQLGIGSFFRVQHTENQMFKPYPINISPVKTASFPTLSLSHLKNPPFGI